MPARNTTQNYGWIARGLHWLVAATVLGMFGLGLWMRGLDYYDPWYQPAPELHISIGLLLMGAMVLRVVWKATNPKPAPIGDNRIEQKLASLAHVGLYIVLFALMITGYLYATAEGRPAGIFGVIQVPAVPGSAIVKGYIGWVHEYLAYMIMALTGLHTAAALKHHFIDRDNTLRRMMRGNPQ